MALDTPVCLDCAKSGHTYQLNHTATIHARVPWLCSRLT
ncbi:hypothetical protein F383_11108 [Gossypium arboreum]|uniref:Uncharacterized protein n=1 Tax=Gossypium arboreum TaxID=29729 RepID=A0A0B0NAL6_GOSAR|nr:hypothetical protein F383_11108 [Gossypium arboreum]